MGVRDQGSGVSWRAGCSLEVEKPKKSGFLFFWIVFFGLLRTVDADRETEGEREEEN